MTLSLAVPLSQSVPAVPVRNTILWHNLISPGLSQSRRHKCGYWLLGRRMTQTLGHGPSHANLWCFLQNSRVTDPSLRLLGSEFVNIFLADSQGPWAEKLWHDRSEWIKNRGQHNNANDWSCCWSLILATGYQSYGSDHYCWRYYFSHLWPHYNNESASTHAILLLFSLHLAQTLARVTSVVVQ